MKKHSHRFLTAIVLAIMLLLFFAGKIRAQPFIGIGLLNKGAQFQLGMLSGEGGISVSLAVKKPFTHNDKPTVISLNVGKEILLSHNDEDNYSVTPSFGLGNYRVKDYSLYDTGKDEIIQVSEIKPVYGIEIGKDSYLGRLYINANYCKGLYYGIGFKMFFARYKN